jgi:hypothetical protein
MTKQTVRIHGTDVVDKGSVDLDNERIDLPDGTRLTEAGAEDLAAEVLRAAGRGRPSLTAPGRRSPQLRLSVPEGVRDGLRQRAAVERRSVSEVAREALEQYLAS